MGRDVHSPPSRAEVSKWFQISVKHNDICLYLYFYPDMFQLIDHHQVICIKRRIRLCSANSKLTNCNELVK
jgi:hypothetical protein